MLSAIRDPKNLFSMRLSTRIAVLFLALLVLSLALASFLAYRSATGAVLKEIERAFEQRHATVAHLINGRLRVLDAHLGDAARNPLFFEAVAHSQEAQQRLLFLLDSPAGQHLDLLFVLDESGALLLDLGSPLFPVDRLVSEVGADKRKYLQGWQLVHTPQMTAIIKALAMINPVSGRVEGYLFGGVSLSKNPALIRFLMQESGVEHLSLRMGDEPVAAFPAMPANAAQVSGREAFLHEDGLYYSDRRFRLFNQVSDLRVMLGIDDRSYLSLQKAYLFNFLWVSIVLLPLFALAVFIIHRSTERGAKHLIAYADSVGQSGRQEAVFVPTGIAEYDRLGEVFTQMVAEQSRQQKTIQKLFDGAAGPMIIWDSHLVITQINKAAAAFFDKEIDAVIGTGVIELFARTRPASIRDLLAQSIQNNEGYFELECTHKKGTKLRHAIWNITSVGSRSGGIVAVIAQGQEVTHLKETEAALLSARDAADRANQAKSRFLANMSHELRTPLNAILGYSEMLLEEEGVCQPRARADLERIHRSGRHLLFLVGDVLDIASFEAGHVELEPKPVRLSSLIEPLKELLQYAIAQSGSRFGVEIPDELFVLADERKLTQSLYHMLSNAFKFASDGTVTLRAKKERSRAVIEVSDTGIGMSDVQIAHLFTPFWQADDSTTRRYGGSGLGLALVQNFIQMMGGTITVKSQPGAGSCFTITLPTS